MQSAKFQCKNNSTSMKLDTDKIFFILCCIMVALLTIRDVGNVNLSKWIFLALGVMVFLFFDNDYMAIFLCFLIPFIVGIPNSYIFLVGLIIFIGKNLKKIIINIYILGLFLIFIIEFLSFIYGGFSIGDYIRFVAPLSLISLIIFNDKDNFDYGKMLLYFLFAAVSAELNVIFQSTNLNGLNNLISSGLRLGNTKQLLLEEGMRVSFNPNSLGFLCAFSISILILLLDRNIKHIPIKITLLVFQILIGIMSLSRSFLVILGIIALVYWLSLAESLWEFIKGFSIITVITIGICASINHYYPNLLTSIYARFAVEDISNGRLDIMELYFNVLTKHPERLIFGVGLQGYNEKSGVMMSCHNGTQEILITWGVIGLLSVAFYIFGLYEYGMRGASVKGRKIIYLLPLIILIIDVQSGQFFSSSIIPLYFLPVYAAMRLAKSVS